MNRQQRRAAERKGGAGPPAPPAHDAAFDPAFVQAAQLHRAGRLGEAEAALRQIVAVRPRHADALHLLGVIQLQQERAQAALDLLQQAVAIDGRQATFHNNLASALRALGRADKAIASYRRALAIRPDYPRALVNLGQMLDDQGQGAEAMRHLRRALALAPQDVDAMWRLATVLSGQGAPDEAADLYERALTITPASVEMLENLAKIRAAQERTPDLIAVLRRLIALRPDFADYWRALAVALTLVPDLAGATLAYREAIRCEPASGAAHNGLANVLADQRRLDEAVAAYREAVRLEPQVHTAHSNLIMTLHAMTDVTAADVLAQSRRFATRVEAGPATAFAPGGDPERRLRVGYVSADFRIHPVGFFLERVLAAHDPARVEIVLYSDTAFPDAQTDRLRAAGGRWTPILGLPDDAVGRRIRDDGVDILVDLAGHTGDNRLPVFGARAAPVQASWLGYFGTTGLTRMDYVIADDVVIPPGEEALYSETVVRLPTPYLCWSPPHEDVPVAPPPMRRNGFVTFGCFNNPRKITAEVVATWAEILRRVDGARLFLKYWNLADAACRGGLIDAFAAHGVAPERLTFEGITPRLDALAAYDRVDIALDPFPFAGCTTTADTLWMGAPVVSLKGDRWPGRMSAMILTSVGLGAWAATDREAYVETAVRGAGDAQGLAALRGELRGRMAASAFCDGARLAGHLEDAYRAMWRRWCASERS
jgi:predicted O-linked N-acetylglucosamine transferase (SPINDLY family)